MSIKERDLMNPDFAIILNFKLKSTKDVDADFLVKTARNIGARAVTTDQLQADFEKACAKYTIALVDAQTGVDLTPDNVIDETINHRKDGNSIFINVEVDSANSLSENTTEMFTAINNWMHIFGHALNESEPCACTSDNGFVLQNRHMQYQKYVFVKKPLAQEVVVDGITVEPNRIEMIEKRTEPKFSYEDGKLTIDLADIPESDFDWQIIRVQEHRPEDDIKETKF